MYLTNCKDHRQRTDNGIVGVTWENNNLAQYLDNHLAGDVVIFLEKLLQELQEDQDVVRRIEGIGAKETKVKEHPTRDRALGIPERIMA
uniref:Uncharacterized protein n=1 Tax=Geobacter sp. (strain M21) TaxID=443144 RepID=C6DYR4_GEOSM